MVLFASVAGLLTIIVRTGFKKPAAAFHLALSLALGIWLSMLLLARV